MSAYNGVEFAQFHAVGIIAAILVGYIHVRAFSAAHFYHNAWAFFSHCSCSFTCRFSPIYQASIADFTGFGKYASPAGNLAYPQVLAWPATNNALPTYLPDR